MSDDFLPVHNLDSLKELAAALDGPQSARTRSPARGVRNALRCRHGDDQHGPAPVEAV